MATMKQELRQKDTFWRRWGAVFILVVFFILSWGGQFVFQLQTEMNQAETHHQAFQMSDFWPQFLSSTFENWQSEWLQLATQAILIAALADYVFRKGNEDHYKTQMMIDELRQEITAQKKKK